MRNLTSVLFAISFLFAVAFLANHGANSECNVCSAITNIACVSETNFQVCNNGIVVAPINSCPEGFVCSNIDCEICKPRDTAPVLACAACNRCDSTNTFACTGINTYALCLGTDTISEITGSCTADYVCNINNQNICSQPSLGVVPTCPTVVNNTAINPNDPNSPNDPNTPTNPPTFEPGTMPTEYCRIMQQEGRFPAGRELETTCRQYVSCFLSGNIWYGQLYDCPGASYFNSSSRLCGTEVPANCQAGVGNMILRGSIALH